MKKQAPEDIQALIAENEEISKESQQTKKAIIKDDPNMDIEEVLKERYFEELEQMEHEWELGGRNGRKPTTISPLRCASILEEYFSFALFDLEQNSRVAIYLPKEGIYTQNETLIKRIIALLEPKHNSYRANDVIYYLTMRAKVKERTYSRYLIPVQNGVFNLQTKELEPFTPDYVFTSKIATPYVENPPLPEYEGWNVEDWINELASGEEKLITLLWQIISDSMNGNYSRKQSIWLYSEGSTGKGSYQTLIQNLIGVDNVATLKLPQFSERFSLPMLEGKVCCIGDDVPAGVYIDNSSNFNSVVTGERIPVEQKNQPVYSTSFNMTIIQSTNGLPKIHNKSEGTYRRFLIVQFKKQYTGKRDNWNIKNDYLHREEVLQYVLYKAIHMDFERFVVPDSSKQLLEKYKIDNDPIRDFKVSVFDEFESTRIPIYLVYQYYLDFCDENRHKPMTKRNFLNQFEQILDSEWEKKTARLSTFFKEKHLPKQLDRNMRIEYPDEKKTYKCYVNTLLELVS